MNPLSQARLLNACVHGGPTRDVPRFQVSRAGHGRGTVDRRFGPGVRPGSGRAERRPGRLRVVRRPSRASRGQRVWSGERGFERHRAASKGVQADRPADQDSRRHRRTVQDFGVNEQRVGTNRFPGREINQQTNSELFRISHLLQLLPFRWKFEERAGPTRLVNCLVKIS